MPLLQSIGFISDEYFLVDSERKDGNLTVLIISLVDAVSYELDNADINSVLPPDAVLIMKGAREDFKYIP